MLKTRTEPPGKLGGTPGACMSPHYVVDDYSHAETKNISPPLRVTRELAESIKRRYPIEGSVLDLMILDGRAVLVDEGV